MEGVCSTATHISIKLKEEVVQSFTTQDSEQDDAYTRNEKGITGRN